MNVLRKLFFAICLIAVTANLQGQQVFSVKNKRAIELYKQAKATQNEEMKIKLLQDAIASKNKFVEAYWELARVYARQGNLANAISTLDIIDNEKFPYRSEAKYIKADIYYNSGAYEEASNLLAEIDTSLEPNYLRRVTMLSQKCKDALDIMSEPVDFHPVNMKNINTIYDDYFPSITADNQMISTTVLLPVKSYSNEIIRHQEDLYVSHIRQDGSWSYSESLPAPINSIQGNEGSQSFSSDGRYMFFVRCDHPDNVGSFDVYYSIRQGDRWSNPINLGEPANSRYWESNPVMSSTGDMIYFTSNRPGGAGKRDIWTVQVKIANDGTLKTFNAQPLNSINTIEDEFAPFIHADNQTLYFTSNGHKGLGSFDVFMSRLTEQGWSTPVNLGYPINTYGEESGFVVNGLGTKAYFASDKIENNGKGLEIYELDLPESLQPKPMVYSPGRVYDADTKKPLQAHVEIFDKQTNKKYFESLSDKMFGDFTCVLPQSGSYGLSVQLDSYLYYTASIDHAGDSIIIALQPIKQGSSTCLKNLYFDTDSDVILPISQAEILRLYEFLKKNKDIKIEIVGHTDDTGSRRHNQDLSLRRANALMQVLTEKGISSSRMSVVGKGSSEPVVSNETEAGRAQNRRVEVVIK